MSLTGCLTPSYGPNLVNCGIFTSVHTPFPAFFIFELDNERPVGRVLRALSSSPSGIYNHNLISYYGITTKMLLYSIVSTYMYAWQAKCRLISIEFIDVKLYTKFHVGCTCLSLIDRDRCKSGLNYRGVPTDGSTKIVWGDSRLGLNSKVGLIFQTTNQSLVKQRKNCS